MRAMFKLNWGAELPAKAHRDDVGYDLRSIEHVTLQPGEVTKVHTGILYGGFDTLTEASASQQCAIFPKIEGRSGLASKGIWPVGGIVDPGYRGELVVMLYNSTKEPFEVAPADRIAQIVFYTTAQPDVAVGELKPTERGDSGFGSTGK